MTTASALVAKTATPTSVEDLWEPIALLSPNWVQPIVVSSGYRTSVFAAKSGAETRYSLLDSPSRVVSFTGGVYSAAAVRLASELQARMLKAGTLIPLWSDFTSLDADALATDTVLSCDAQYRRFSVGARVALVSYVPGAPVQETFELRTIAAVGAGSITVDALAANWGAGTLIVPLIEASIRTEVSSPHITSLVGSPQIEGLERVGAMSLDASASEGAYPGTVATFDSIPIWKWYDNDSAESEEVIESTGGATPLGAGSVPFSEDGLARRSWQFSRHFDNRAEFWEFLQTFDAAKGRLGTFWLMSPNTDIDHVSVGTGSITAVAVGPEELWNDVSHVGVELYDGTIYIREISLVTRGAGQDVLTLASALPALAAGDIMRVATARKYRLSSDEITETWVTDQHVTVSCGLVEIHNEASISVTVNTPFVGPVGSLASSGCGDVIIVPTVLEAAKLAHFDPDDEATVSDAGLDGNGNPQVFVEDQSIYGADSRAVTFNEDYLLGKSTVGHTDVVNNATVSTYLYQDAALGPPTNIYLASSVVRAGYVVICVANARPNSNAIVGSGTGTSFRRDGFTSMGEPFRYIPFGGLGDVDAHYMTCRWMQSDGTWKQASTGGVSNWRIYDQNASPASGPLDATWKVYWAYCTEDVMVMGYGSTPDARVEISPDVGKTFNVGFNFAGVGLGVASPQGAGGNGECVCYGTDAFTETDVLQAVRYFETKWGI